MKWLKYSNASCKNYFINKESPIILLQPLQLCKYLYFKAELLFQSKCVAKQSNGASELNKPYQGRCLYFNLGGVSILAQYGVLYDFNFHEQLERHSNIFN